MIAIKEAMTNQAVIKINIFACEYIGDHISKNIVYLTQLVNLWNILFECLFWNYMYMTIKHHTHWRRIMR